MTLSGRFVEAAIWVMESEEGVGGEDRGGVHGCVEFGEYGLLSGHVLDGGLDDELNVASER